jgi:hypothetical protein
MMNLLRKRSVRLRRVASRLCFAMAGFRALQGTSSSSPSASPSDTLGRWMARFFGVQGVGRTRHGRAALSAYDTDRGQLHQGILAVKRSYEGSYMAELCACRRPSQPHVSRELTLPAGLPWTEPSGAPPL